MKNPLYRKRVLSYLSQKMQDDIGDRGDITTDNVVSKKLRATATIKSKQNGIIAGIEEITLFYKKYGLKAKCNFKDGDSVKAGDIIFILNGNAQTLLKTERTGLNFLQMMSGIASNTRRYVDAIKGYYAKVAATRKCWADEYLEKKAVFVGGALTHRIGLHGAIMIKDNHLKAVELELKGNKNFIQAAIERAYNTQLHCGVIIEVKNKKEAIFAAEIFRRLKQKKSGMIPTIMLDNMSFTEEKKTVLLIHDAALIEASGNVDLTNIVNHAKTGVDVISTSRLNRGAGALDLSQKIMIKAGI